MRELAYVLLVVALLALLVIVASVARQRPLAPDAAERGEWPDYETPGEAVSP